MKNRFRRVAAAIGTILASSGLDPAANGAAATSVRLAEQMPPHVTACPFPTAALDADVTRRSVYVEMADHVRLAVDIFTPAKDALDTRLPTLFTATRYWRGEKGAPLSEVGRRWIAAGYAVVAADVRGTGASFGQWYIPYARQEAEDLGFLANWIARQAWSNGSVVMTGSSYPGTTPLMTAAYGTPAIKAIAPKFSDFDMYADLLWPGGVTATDLIVGWGRMVHALDLNQPEDTASHASVRPVDGPDGVRLLAAAIEDHKKNPWSFDQAAGMVTFRDVRSEHMHGMDIDGGNVSSLDDRIQQGGVPIFGWGSWLDSGIAQGLLNRFMTLKNPQLTIIGPWTHGARENVNVFDPGAELDPPRAMQDQWVYCYLDNAVRTGGKGEPVHRVLYYTMGENRWKSTDVWPVQGTRARRFYLDAAGRLADRPPQAAGQDAYRVDFEASTGVANRWATQAGGPRINYGDRSEADKQLLTYTTAPLGSPLEITGQAVITLHASSNRTDGNFLVYLEDVAPDGRSTYLTEGSLRAIHRRLSDRPGPYRTTYPHRSYASKDAQPLVPGEAARLVFQLQATSVRLDAGHRLRVALAGADKGNFLPVPADSRDVQWQVLRGGGSQASFIEVPEIPAITTK